MFLWCPLSCPSPFFVPASFLPSSWLPSPSPIHLAFVLGRFALLFFLSSRYFFSAGWLFLLVFFFLLVLVWGASHCCCSHFLFHLDFSAQFLFLVCLVDQLWRRLIFFVIELINAKGGFSCGKNGKIKKQVKQRDAGVCSIKSEMRYPSFNGTRGCAKLAQKHAMENGGKTRKMAENTIKIVVLGKIE